MQKEIANANWIERKKTKIADESKENDYFLELCKPIKNSDAQLFTQRHIVYSSYIYFNQTSTNNE